MFNRLKLILGICIYRSLAKFIAMLLLAEFLGQLVLPVTATAASTGIKIAQQEDSNRAAALKAFNEGDRLYEQETAESLKQAIEKFKEALPLFQAANYRFGFASTLDRIGNVYDDLGEKQKALYYYNQALPLFRAEGARKREVITLNNIGSVYNDVGEKQKALDYYNQALPLFRALGEKLGEATTLNNIGLVYNSLGEKQKALDYYNQSLPILRTLGDQEKIATVLNNIGRVYDDLGEAQLSLDYYTQALPVVREIGSRLREAFILNNIGLVYSNLNEKQKALDYYNQALPIFQALGDRYNIATTLNNIGLIYHGLGEKQKALDYYNQALPLEQAVGDRATVAIIINNIGLVYQSFGDHEKALDYFNQALSLERAVVARSSEAGTLFNIALVERNRGNFKAALTPMEGSIEIVDSLRNKITSQQLRTSYFATVQDYYKFYIDLLMQLHKTNPNSGYDSKALEVSERARARSLLELLAEAHADIRQGVDPKLVEQEHSLQQQLDEYEKEQVQLSGGEHTEAQAAELQQKIALLQNQYNLVEAQIREKSPHYAALTQPVPLTLSEIRSTLLDDNTLLLEYSLGKDRSYLWAVTKTGMTSYELPKSADIEIAAKQFRELITHPILSKDTEQVNKAASELSQLILAPVAARLEQKRLVIVADGVLQYIPYATLSNPVAKSDTSQPAKYAPLIVEHEIVNLPSASTLGISRREIVGRTPAPRLLAVLADPVFSTKDIRVNPAQPQSRGGETPPNIEPQGRGGVSLNRLKFTRQEAEAIMALVPENERQQQFDFDASLAAATSPQLSQYRIVHFATHGILNSTYPELSELVFSLVDKNGNATNGDLTLNKIFNLKLPAELIVLSACKTASGKEIKGEGIVGLTRGFMYAGAPRIIASLWSVNDSATAELMSKFYQGYLKQGLTAAVALRAAQLQMWQQQKWQSPYYWGAFTLQGEWR